MPKRKHVKKNPVPVCGDANQRTRESIAERERIAAAKQKKFEMLRQQYFEEIQRQKEAEEGALKYLNKPGEAAKPGADVANE